MSDTFKGTASCLCGGVTLTADTANSDLGACHCSMCRKWGGGPLFAVDCGTSVEIKGENNVSVYTSSDWAERGFCKTCGSHLYYRLRESGQYIVCAGLFDGEPAFVFGHQVFIDEKPSYYEFSNPTNDMTGAELFALYAPSD